MKFIITGGAGFIGHNVVRQLESLGHECVIIDCLTNYGFISQLELEYLVSERKKRINSVIREVDICDFKAVEVMFHEYSYNADAVIHLASFPRQKVVNQHPVLGAQVMAPALINLLELTAKYKIPKFVYISSSMVYGNFANDVTEDSPCNPIGQYGILKYTGEKLVEDYTRRGCFDYVIVRPSAVYGEWDVEDRVVSKFVLAAIRGNTLKVNGDTEVLDFTYVEDTAQGIALAATKSAANNKIFNITRSASEIYTLKDAAEIAINIAGSGSIEICKRDDSFPSRGRLSIERAVTELGYKPGINIEQGFRRYHDWFKTSTFWQNKLNKIQ